MHTCMPHTLSLSRTHVKKFSPTCLDVFRDGRFREVDGDGGELLRGLGRWVGARGDGGEVAAQEGHCGLAIKVP